MSRRGVILSHLGLRNVTAAGTERGEAWLSGKSPTETPAEFSDPEVCVCVGSGGGGCGGGVFLGQATEALRITAVLQTPGPVPSALLL